MTDPFHRLLRGTLDELANQAQPAALLTPARRKARQIQRRRRIVAVGAVAGAAALTLFATLAAPSLLAKPDGLPPGVNQSPTPTGTTAPAPTLTGPQPASAVQMPGGYIVLAAVQQSRSQGSSYVWDRNHKKYVRMSVDGLDPAPAGTLVQVVSESGYRVIDLRTGEAVKLDGMVRPMGDGLAAWSADGTKLGSTSFSKTRGGLSLTTANVVTGDVSTRDFDGSTVNCGDFCRPTWHPNGTELGLPLTDTTVPHDEALPDVQRGLEFYTVGVDQPTRFLPLKGFVAGPESWSPDGKKVIIVGTTSRTEDRRLELQIVDAVSGRLIREVGAAHQRARPVWIDNDSFLVPVGSAVLQYSSDGKQIGDGFEVPPAFANRTLILGRP